MKKLIIISIATVSTFCSSCTSLDVMVDKSQLKAETETHAIYPSTAVSPIVNADQLNMLIDEQLSNVNKSIRSSTK